MGPKTSAARKAYAEARARANARQDQRVTLHLLHKLYHKPGTLDTFQRELIHRAISSEVIGKKSFAHVTGVNLNAVQRWSDRKNFEHASTGPSPFKKINGNVAARSQIWPWRLPCSPRTVTPYTRR